MKSKRGYCAECGNEFTGRLDKKFCDDTCRSAFNNRKYSNSVQLIRKINRILSKNRKILKQLNPKETTKIRREVMIQMGFNFHYFTNLYETTEGKCYYFCYDYGYLFLNEELIMLVIRKDYVTEKQKQQWGRELKRS